MVADHQVSQYQSRIGRVQQSLTWLAECRGAFKFAHGAPSTWPAAYGLSGSVLRDYCIFFENRSSAGPSSCGPPFRAQGFAFL
jgi:hypothetical protein